ncbi:hypothetical protein OIDMADRAFT_176424 [Oidiodendron maius Zn]|uniref:Zn(2)-C6 fungal-type domain-containing protein n=1 Tax=Oidiodendron maius (strain Zn) TaxID=913774 RepID=A0A0C3HVS1_OIDMZ|nr:hypothetical protein OIDMADRAFT_176424 [Oidiodendron maius Zn]
MAAIGPLDRRTCEGGPPCRYCIKKKQKCVPQATPTKTDVVFVNISTEPTRSTTRSAMIRPSMPEICPKMREDNLSLFINNFFSNFLARNDFGVGWDHSTMIYQFQKSPSLYHASIAVGALDMSRRLSSFSSIQAKDAVMGSIMAYAASLTQLHTEIESENLGRSDITLWTTLLLGLFELMRDKTGDGFVKHLSGTSSLLRLRGPEAHISGPGRSFFLTVRVFEICRSLIYSEPTFLCHPEWISLMMEIKREDINNTLHPKERLLDLMTECSSLSHRVRSLIRPASTDTIIDPKSSLVELAAEGLLIRSALDNWYIDFMKWSTDFDTLEQNFQSILAIIYFHAISIYLSGIFDYHSQFNDMPTPALSQPVIQGHVNMILTKTTIAMKTTNLSPLLFFFPLRVAGARVTSILEAGFILELLQEISNRSFPVAEAFTEDLKNLWQWKCIC